jgi:hypothetical protein
MTLEEIFAKVQESVKSRTQFGLCVVTNTKPTFAKAKSCPYTDRVEKLTIYGNATFANYGNKVNSNLEKAGKDGNFVPLPSWAEWLRGELFQIVCRHKNYPEKLYLSICGQECDMTFDHIWLLDGRIATETELADIKLWLPKKSENHRQAESGLSGEEQILYRRVALPNVVAICTNKADAEVALKNELAKVQVQVAV